MSVDPRLAKLEATVAAGTVSDRWILFCAGGLPSKVADRCTDDRNKTGSSDNCSFCVVIGGALSSAGGVTQVAGFSNAPRGSFSVTSVRGETL